MNQVQKNYYFFNTLKTTGFLVPILFIYLNNILVLSISEILSIAAIYNVVPFIFELPLGYLGDKIGNKKIVVLALIFQIISCLSLLLLEGTWAYQGYLLSIYIAGAAFSGADKALIRSHFAQKDDTGFRNYLMAIQSKFYRNTIFILLVGAASFSISPYLPIVLQGISFFIALVYLQKIEDKCHKVISSKQQFTQDLRLIKNFIWQDKNYLALILVNSLFSSLILVNHKTIQMTLTQFIDWDKSILIGLIYVGGNLVSYQGSKTFINRYLNSWNLFQQMAALLILVFIAFSLLAIKNIGLIILGYLLICIFKSIYRPLLASELTNKIPFPHLAATILSVGTLISSLIAVGVHYLAAPLFQNPLQGNFFLILIVSPFILLSMLFLRRSRPWSLKMGGNDHTGKENILKYQSEHFVFSQVYPANLNPAHFVKLEKSFAQTLYPRPQVLKLDKENRIIDFDYAAKPNLIHCTPTTQLEICQKLLNHFTPSDFAINAAVPDYDAIFADQLTVGVKEKLQNKNLITFIHGDLHPENILVDNQSPIVIDWDNSGRGYFWFDLLNLLSSPWLKITKIERFNLFRGHYPNLEVAELDRIFSAFIAFKISHLANLADTPYFCDLIRKYQLEQKGYCHAAIGI